MPTPTRPRPCLRLRSRGVRLGITTPAADRRHEHGGSRLRRPRRWLRRAVLAAVVGVVIVAGLVAEAGSAPAGATGTAGTAGVVPPAVVSPTAAASPAATQPTTAATTPPATTTPAPTATAVVGATAPASPTGDDGGGGGGGGGGWFDWVPGLRDVTDRVGEAFNGWFAGIAEGAAEPVLRLVGRTVLSTPDVTDQDRIRELWGASLLIADSLFLLVLTVGGLAVMGEGLVHGRAMAREFAPRMVVSFATAHLSLLAMSWGSVLANGLTGAIVGQQVTAEGITSLLFSNLVVGAYLPIYLVLLELGVLALAVALIVGWIVRMVVMMVLAAGAPLMLIWHGLPWTEGLAALWWRALAGCLAVQVGQSLLLLVGTRVLLSADDRPVWMPSTDALLNTLAAGALFYVAIRLQGWVLQLVLRATGGGRPTLLTLVQYRTVRRVATAIAA